MRNLPSGWQFSKLGEECDLISGQHINAKDYNVEGKGIGYLTGPADFSHLNPIVSKWTEHPKRTAIENDILITVKGSGVGKVNLMSERELAISRQLMAVRSRGVTIGYLYKFLSYHFNYFQALGTGAAIPGLSRSDVLGLDIPLPPLPEQKRIVAILDEAFAGIDKAIANTERNLENARELFESYLNQSMSKTSDGWVERLIGDMVRITHGYAFKGKDFEVSNDSALPIVLTPGNYTEAATLCFDSKNTKRLKTLPPEGYEFNVGDLTIVMTDLSSKMKILGKPAFIESDQILHNQRVGRIIFNEDALNERFLYYYLQTQSVSDNIKGTSTGTMVRHTAPKRILSNKISFPVRPSEQIKIVAKLDSIKEDVQRLEVLASGKISLLKELKQSILHKAFSGELTSDPIH